MTTIKDLIAAGNYPHGVGHIPMVPMRNGVIAQIYRIKPDGKWPIIGGIPSDNFEDGYRLAQWMPDGRISSAAETAEDLIYLVDPASQAVPEIPRDTMKLTGDGTSLVKQWQHDRQRVERARRESLDAAAALRRSTNALGKWLMPPDARDCESIAVWFHDSLIAARRMDEKSSEFEVTLRYRGREWGRL